ncbi:MAG: M81 family metallopeptidase [Bacillota bacterium]|nr:M81 family metallopeptidase [Bacillota bacterium]
MRIAIAGLSHETHTFLPDKTGLPSFDEDAVRGQDIISTYRPTNSSIGGFIQVCEPAGVELVPIVYSAGGVAGTVKDEVYDKYVGEICAGLAAVADSIDAVLLSLHGAMVTESRQDTETHILKDVRKAVGYDIPIMVALDLHGNLDPAILTKATAIFGYQSSPHVDSGETGRRAARAMLDCLAGKTKPVTAMAKPGLVVPSLYSATTVSPGKDIIDRLRQWEGKPRVIDVSFFFGFAWSDVHQLGVSAVAVTDNAPELARVIVDDLAAFAWERRERLTHGPDLYSVEDGVALAIRKGRTAKKPICVLDHSDRLNDTTFVLHELLRQNAQDAAMPLLYDPEAARACLAAGQGNQVDVLAGGKSSPQAGGPVRLKGRVEWAGEKKYMGTGPMSYGKEQDLGLCAVVQAGGVWVQLVSHPTSLIDEDPITQFGRKTGDFKVIVSKSKTHFRAVYEKVAEEIITVDAPAYSPADLSVFDYKNVPRGVYPITRK